MKAENINKVGSSLLSSTNEKPIRFSINKSSSIFTAELEKFDQLSIFSKFSTIYGEIQSSVGNKQPILIFRPYAGETFIEISFPNDDFLNIDVQLTHPLKICNLPVKLHAECLKNKPLISIEAEKDFNLYQNFIKGNLFVKYGKSLDTNVRLSIPYFDFLISVDPSRVKVQGLAGIPTLFASYTLTHNYISNQHQVGAYLSHHRFGKISLTCDPLTKESEVRTEVDVNKSIALALSAKKGNKKKQPIEYQIGASYVIPNKYVQKTQFKVSLPSNELLFGLNGSYKNVKIGTSLKYTLPSKSYGFGIDIVYDE